MNIILKGDICYSTSPDRLSSLSGGYLVCSNNTVCGVFTEIPEEYESFPVKDCGNRIIIPGFCDLHTHAPQFAFRGLGMSLELLEWLNTYTYPEEAKYSDLDYAEKAYRDFTDALTCSATTRASIFATVHLPATMLLTEMLEGSGIVSYTGLVNMDRNCPETLRSKSFTESYDTCKKWLELTSEKFANTKPILTPRFIPTCSDELMRSLKTLQEQYNLPVQSHMSENTDEIKWVRELSPGVKSYAAAYNSFGLFGGDGVPTVMAHCVWCEDEDIGLLKENRVYIAHCPGSNTNIASGIAPVRRYMSQGINIGLGSDVAGGTHLSMFRAIADTVQVSKLYWRLIDDKYKPLTFNEAFYLATAGGGSFFGKAGSFEKGYEFDALVLDDSNLQSIRKLSIEERLERLAYIGDDNCVTDKYVRGKYIYGKDRQLS